MIAWVPTTAPRRPTATISPAAHAQTASRRRWIQATRPLAEPANVDSPIAAVSATIVASGGIPPPVRHAIPTSIAPAPIVTAATVSPASVPAARTPTTGIAATSPDRHDTAERSKRAARRSARATAEGS